MKKALFLAVILGMLICSTSVFANNNIYDLTTDDITITHPDPSLTTVSSWSLSNPQRYFNDATLTITAGGITPHSVFGEMMIGVLNAGTNVAFNLFQGALNFTQNVNGTWTATLGLTGKSLDTFNAYLRTNPALLNFNLTTYGATPTIIGVRLNGTLGGVAPEPLSMALVGAGLVCLPFARRLRKAVTKEA